MASTRLLLVRIIIFAFNPKKAPIPFILGVQREAENGSPQELMLVPCDGLVANKFFLEDPTTKKQLVKSETECDFSFAETGSCLDLNAADCEYNSVSFEIGGCSTGCLPYTIKETSSETHAFYWTDTEPFLHINDDIELNETLLMENWKDTTYKEASHFNLTCSMNHEWIFEDPQQRKVKFDK